MYFCCEINEKFNTKCDKITQQQSFWVVGCALIHIHSFGTVQSSCCVVCAQRWWQRKAFLWNYDAFLKFNQACGKLISLTTQKRGGGRGTKASLAKNTLQKQWLIIISQRRRRRWRWRSALQPEFMAAYKFNLRKNNFSFTNGFGVP